MEKSPYGRRCKLGSRVRVLLWWLITPSAVVASVAGEILLSVVLHRA